ncbi:MAG: hypothetical protein LBU98_04535 [Alistipes sp.]|jgi:hypothetical protein|nr:hypothetical protein [Alistipes sp.]
MRPEILALFIPLVFLVGLFGAISLHIYYKYKVRVTTAEHARGESLDAWCRAEAMARASVSRSAALRVGGFLTGAGIGMAAGVWVGASESVWSHYSRIFEWDQDGRMVLCTLFLLVGAMLVGGAGMICAYFLDRAFEGKKEVKQLKPS